MDTVPIYPTTQPALVLGHLTLPIALRHLGMDCEADAMESSPANIQAAAEYAANMMETTITRDEFITIMDSIKPLLQFLFFKELARLSPEHYGWLDSYIEDKFAPAIANIKNTPLLVNMMGGGEAEDFKAIQTKILEWKEHAISGNNDDVLKPIETAIRKLIAQFQIKYNTKVSPIKFNRESPESLTDITYMNAVTGRTNKKDTFCQHSLKGIVFTASLLAFAAIGSIVAGERFRRLRDTVSIERNAAVAKISIQKGVCTTMSSTLEAKYKTFMAGYSSCDTAFDPARGNIEINAAAAINAYKANNPMFYLSDIPLLGAYCGSSVAPPIVSFNIPTTLGATKTNTTATASAPGYSTGICNFPIGYPNPAIGVAAVQRYVTGVLTLNFAPTANAVDTDKAGIVEINETVERLVGLSKAAVASAKTRFAEARKEARESSKFNTSFFATLLSVGASLATGATALFGVTGIMGGIGRVVGIAGSAMGVVGRTLPRLGTDNALTEEDARNARMAQARRKEEIEELRHQMEKGKLQAQLAQQAQQAQLAQSAAIPQPPLGRAGSSGSRRGGRMPTRRRVNRKLRNTRKRR